MKKTDKSIGIVASLFNKDYVDGLIESAIPLLKGRQVKIVRVPGAFEIPLAAKQLLKKKNVGGVIAFGLIWQGKTDHARLLAESVTFALMNLMLEYEKPVIHQVLSVENETQAKARCFGKELNRGREAAQAIVKLLD